MQFIGFDIETDGDKDAYGLQPNRVLQGEAKVTSASFVKEDGSVIFGRLNPTIPELRTMLMHFAADSETFPDAVLVGWNTQFDVAWLIALGLEDEVRACRWADGEVLRRALENDMSEPGQKSYGLKQTVAIYLPEFAGYANEVGGDFTVVNDTLLKYNILDAGLTARLARTFTTLLDPRRLRLADLISLSIIPVAKAWVNGIPLDPEAVDLWEVHMLKEKAQHLADVLAHGGIAESEAALAEKMMASHVQLKRYLHHKGIMVAKTNRTELSKNEFASIPLVKSVSNWKLANTATDKFIKSIRKSIEYNGATCTHPSCRLWNTYTGRFGYTSTCTKKKYQTGIAIHQFPRSPEARNCIVAPKGYCLGELDFSTQESRLLADFSNDPVLIDIFASGKDFHTFMAALIDQIDYEDMKDRIAGGDKDAKNSRQLAKVVNLSCAYRTGWKTLIDVGRTQYNVDFDDRTARKLHGMFRDTYKQVPIYWDTAVFTAKDKGYAETRGGRRVAIDNWSRSNAWKADSTAINFPIQGTASDMKFLAIAMIEEELHAAGGYYMLDLHDALFTIVPDTSAGFDCAVSMRDTLSNLPYKEVFGWEPRVKLPVDLKYGKAWGSLKEIK